MTTEQARRCGLTHRQIGRRLASGRWVRLAPGVYRIAGAPITDPQRAYAAVLAAGQARSWSGATALALLGVGRAPAVPTIARPPSASARTRACVVRRSPVDPQDRTAVGPIPCTTPARALLEAAPSLTDEALEGMVDDVLDRRLATPAGLLGAIRRAPMGHGRSGAPRLRAAMEPWLGGIVPGSPAEARLVRRPVGLGASDAGPTARGPVAVRVGSRSSIWPGRVRWPGWSTTARGRTPRAVWPAMSSARKACARWDGGSDASTVTTWRRRRLGCARADRPTRGHWPRDTDAAARRGPVGRNHRVPCIDGPPWFMSARHRGGWPAPRLTSGTDACARAHRRCAGARPARGGGGRLHRVLAEPGVHGDA